MSSRFSGPGASPARNERCSTPVEHAKRASDLLAAVDAVERRILELTDDEHLQLAVTGGIGASNRNVEHTVRLATAHALTALALERTDEQLAIAQERAVVIEARDG